MITSVNSIKILFLSPADKAANNIIAICKTYYIETLIKELGINSLDQINSTYVPSTVSYEKILKSHSDFVKSVGLNYQKRTKIFVICTGPLSYTRLDLNHTI